MTEAVSMYGKYFKDPKREPVLIDYVRTTCLWKVTTMVSDLGIHNI